MIEMEAYDEAVQRALAAEAELRELQEEREALWEMREKFGTRIGELQEGWARTIKEWSEAEAGPMTMDEARAEVDKLLAADRLGA